MLFVQRPCPGAGESLVPRPAVDPFAAAEHRSLRHDLILRVDSTCPELLQCSSVEHPAGRFPPLFRHRPTPGYDSQGVPTMFRLDLGSSGRYCDGMNRRSFLQLGMAGMASVALPELFPRPVPASAASPGGRKNTSVILIWLDGGPGHMDMYDMKPDAPAEYRGLWKPIRSKVPGFDVTELYPKQAKITDKFSMVRSLHHDTGDHFAGGHRMLTAKDMGVGGASTPTRFPSIGAIVQPRESVPASA